MIWRFTLVLIKINYGQIGDQKGSFTQQTQYFIQDSRSGGNQCFLPTGMFGNLWLLLTHKPVNLLTCDILEVHGRFYWPGPSGLWLHSKTADSQCFSKVNIVLFQNLKNFNYKKGTKMYQYYVLTFSKWIVSLQIPVT